VPRSGWRLDVAIGAGVALLAVGGALSGIDESPDRSATTILGAAVLGAALGFVRLHARIAAALAVGGLLITATNDEIGLVAYLAVLLLTFEIGRREGTWPGLLALLAIVVASEAGALLNDGSPAPFTFLAPTAWAAGRAVREREIVAARLEERARELEEEREAYAQLSVRYERARIAAELHDIVAHAISVMVVQAGAGQRLARVDPDLTAEAFAAIAASARQAEEDMGRLVTLLSDEEAIGPAPDLHLVEELVGRAAGSGLDVSLRLEGEREGLPAQAVETAYRVVQESLTNALRYASGATVGVLVRGEPQELLVEVANGPAPADAALAGAGTGNGLLGLRERVGACGGRLDAGPVPGGGWLVRARLPRRVPAAA
jgi:signal transduction histidine kinase